MSPELQGEVGLKVELQVKEGSVINMKIDVTAAHLAMGGAPDNNVANDVNL